MSSSARPSLDAGEDLVHKHHSQSSPARVEEQLWERSSQPAALSTCVPSPHTFHALLSTHSLRSHASLTHSQGISNLQIPHPPHTGLHARGGLPSRHRLPLTPHRRRWPALPPSLRASLSLCLSVGLSLASLLPALALCTALSRWPALEEPPRHAHTQSRTYTHTTAQDPVLLSQAGSCGMVQAESPRCGWSTRREGPHGNVLVRGSAQAEHGHLAPILLPTPFRLPAQTPRRASMVVGGSNAANDE